LSQEENKLMQDINRAKDAKKAWERKKEVFEASLSQREQLRFEQFLENPSNEMAKRIPDIPG